MSKSSGNFYQLYTAIIVLFTAPLILMFQNCSPATEEETESNQSSNESVLFTNAKPFPFKVSTNYLSYMSCNNMASGYNTDAYYSFKLGAFKSNFSSQVDGLGFSQAFSDKTRNYDNPGIANTIISTLPTEDLFVQLGIHQQDDLKVQAISGSNLASPLISPLTDQVLLSRLIQTKNTPVYYLNNKSRIAKRHLLGSLNLNNANESVHRDIKNRFSGSGVPLLMTLGYSLGSQNGQLLSPTGAPQGSNAKALGLGYKMNFTSGTTLSSSNTYQLFINGLPSNRTLSRIDEVDLETKQNTSSNWNCPADLKFMIIRHSDADEMESLGACLKAQSFLNPQALSQHQKTVVNLIKQEHWYIDFANRCISPKKLSNSCYGSAGQNKANSYVNYTGQLGGSSACGGTTSYLGKSVLCPHYISICYKN